MEKDDGCLCLKFGANIEEMGLLKKKKKKGKHSGSQWKNIMKENF